MSSVNYFSEVLPASVAAITTTTATSTCGVRGGATGLARTNTVASARGNIVFALTGNNAVTNTNATSRARLDSEPNVTGTAAATTTTSAAATSLLVNTGNGGMAATSTSASAASFVKVQEEFGFTIFVDVLDSAVSLNGQRRRETRRLLANGVEVPIRSYNYNDKAGEIGRSLSVTLARAYLALLPNNAVWEFQAGIWNGTGYSWLSLLENGKMAGRNRSLSKNDDLTPSDMVEIQIRDGLAEKVTAAPNRPIILYNPDLTEQAPLTDTQNALQDINGAPILPIVEAVAGLDLRTVLNRAYVAGCGFSSVVTNLPNFPVARVEFTLENGYDGGVRNLLALFEPIFDVQNNVLWIIDSDASIPVGTTPADLGINKFVSLNEQIEPKVLYDAMIVSYAERGAGADGEFSTERTETPPSQSANFGTPAYTRTDFVNRFRDFRNVDNPSVVTRSILIEAKKTTYGNGGAVISEEIQRDTYDALARKTGHTRVIKGQVPNLPFRTTSLQTVRSETETIAYAPNPFEAGEFVQSSVTIFEEGLVLIDAENIDPLTDEPQRIPFADARVNFLIVPDSTQTFQTLPIRTVKKQLNALSNGQVNIASEVINHLTNTTERSYSEPVPGSASLGRADKLNQKRVRITTGTNQTRKSASFDGGDLPRTIAVLLGRRNLARLNSPPRTGSVVLPLADFTLRKGVARRLYDRAGAIGNFRIVGLSESGQTTQNGIQTTPTIEIKEAI